MTATKRFIPLRKRRYPRQAFVTLLLVGFILFSNSIAFGQYTVTVAGNGISACFQNDYALCTPFSNPYSVCAAANGDLYITCGNSLKKVDKLTKAVTRVAGTDTPGGSGNGGPAVNALMQFAFAVRMDAAGNIYISEYAGHRIRKITAATGIITTVAGNSSPGFSGDGGLATSASINTPHGISIDPAGNLFIADFQNNRIRRVDAITGIITTVAGNGSTTYSGDGGLATSAGTPYPNNICHDRNGNLYITECYSDLSNRVRKVDANTGIITTIAGSNARLHSGDGGLAVNATLIEPVGVAVDPQDNIYIVEYVESRIRKISATTGVITTIAGTGIEGFNGEVGLAQSISLNKPTSLFLDADNNIFIADNFNNRIRKISQQVTTMPDPNPELSISASTTSLCSGNPILFTATSSYTGPNPVYSWLRNGNAVGTNSPTFTGASLSDGDQIKCIITTLICGIEYRDTSNVILLSGISTGPIGISINTNSTSICSGQQAVFTASAVNAGTNPAYQWKINGVNAGINNASFTTASLGNGDVITCVVTADPGLTCATVTTAVSNQITMNVNAAGLPPTITITSTSASVCPGTPITFTASAQNTGPNSSFLWRRNGVPVGNNSSSFTSQNLSDQDIIICELTPDNPCTNAPVMSNSIRVTIFPLPVVTVTPTDTTVSSGTQVLLRAAINGSVNSFGWTPSNAVINASALITTTTPVNAETRFQFNITTAEGCVRISNAIVRVKRPLFMPTSFSPNNDGHNDLFRIPPNSAIELEEFSIYNRWGELIFSTRDAAKGWNGKVANLSQDAGVFIYVVKGENKGQKIFIKGTVSLIR